MSLLRLFSFFYSFSIINNFYNDNITGEVNELMINQSHLEKTLNDLNIRFLKEENHNKEIEKKNILLEKKIENLSLSNNEKDFDHKKEVDGLRKELLHAIQTIEINENNRKEDLEKKDIQLMRMENMGQERELWRQSVSDKSGIYGPRSIDYFVIF